MPSCYSCPATHTRPYSRWKAGRRPSYAPTWLPDRCPEPVATSLGGCRLISQSILHEGRNIELYEQATTRWREYSRPLEQQLPAGTLTLGGFLTAINQPATLRQLHQMVYRTPACVLDGRLKPDPMVDAAFINPHYVGAEFISTLYNRDLKVYANLTTSELTDPHRRLLVIIGARHVRSLQGILRDDPAFEVVEAADYLRSR